MTTVSSTQPASDLRARVLSHLLPTRVGSRDLQGWHRVLLLLCLGGAGFAVLLFRTPPASWNVLWAEDGAIFVDGALRGNPLVVFEPYAGYLHVLPRLESFLAVLVPLSVVPVAVTVLAAAGAAAMSVAIFVFTEYRISSLWIRLAVWASFVTLPIAAAEVTDSLANLHWYLIAAEFWAVSYSARSRRGSVLQMVIVAIAVLSDPLALLLLPVMILRVVVNRTRRERLFFAVFCLAGLVQLGGVVYAKLFANQRTFRMPHPDTGIISHYYAAQVITPTVFGVRLTLRLHEWMPVGVVVIALAVVVGLLVVGILRSSAQRVAVLAFALGSLGFSIVMLLLQWDSLSAQSLFQYQIGTRYMVDPILLLTAAVLIALDCAAASFARPVLLRVIGIVALSWIILLGVLDYRVADVRAGAPSWETGIANAQEQCVDGAHDVRIPITPPFIPGPDVSCNILEHTTP